MPDYDALRDTAGRLINGFGKGGKATFYRMEGGTYDPISDTNSGEAEVAYTVDCTVVPRGANDISTPYGERVQTEYVKILVPAKGFSIVPQPGDEVAIPGRAGRFGVTDCKPIAPDGTSILFSVQAEPSNTT